MTDKQTVYLVRHGEELWNISLSKKKELTKKGIGQILEVSKLLEDDICSNLDSEIVIPIFYSPLPRATISAENISKFFSNRFVNPKLIVRNELYSEVYNVESVVNDIKHIGIIVSHEPDICDYIFNKTGKEITLGNGDCVKMIKSFENYSADLLIPRGDLNYT